MTGWDFAAAHPWTAGALLALVLLLGPRVVVVPLGMVLRWREWRRHPGDCPRCNGTGREPVKS